MDASLISEMRISTVTILNKMAQRDCGIDMGVALGIIEAYGANKTGMEAVIAEPGSIVKDTPTSLSIAIAGKCRAFHLSRCPRLVIVFQWRQLVLDQSAVPATNTSEYRGWVPRELKQFLVELEAVKLAGTGLVEVSPSYDIAGKMTPIAAADLIVEILAVMVQSRNSPRDPE
ncbi:hypothetical protein GQ53DRAFT_818436 [Thozetella sp. PMI_491]|nr:hypothetical protein GQ53DRAFT_818436 [Thozetella sp. PMI_491]